MAYIEVKNLTKSYGDHTVLKDISVSMDEGSLTTLLGASGSGKSTLLRCIAGLEDIDSGQIFINGKNVTQAEPKDRNVGMVFQHYALFPNMTVKGNVKFGLDMQGTPEDEKERRATEMIQLVGLAGKEDAFPHQLSGGQQQRVALARSLVTQPQVLFLDEPLSALDAQIRLDLRRLIKDIQLNLGITMVLVTHDQEEAMTMSEKIYVMANGDIEQEGSPSEIYRQPKTTYVADFIGSHNLFTSEEFEAMVGESVPQASLLAIRPETIQGPVPNVDHYTFHAQVKRTSMLGSVLRFWLDVNGHEIIMDQLNRSLYFREPGDSFDLHLPKEDLILIH